MSETIGGKALRMRRDNDYKGKPKRYKHTYRVGIEGSDEVLFSCDVVGNVTSDSIEFLEGTGEVSFSMSPNRKIMPTRWPVKDSWGSEIGRITQKILGKGVWAAFDASDVEVFRVVNSDTLVEKVGNTIFGGTSAKYGILFQGDHLAATIGKEPREKTTKKGLGGFLQAFTIPSDWVIHFLPDAPDFDLRLILPAMILLIDYTVVMDSAD